MSRIDWAALDLDAQRTAQTVVHLLTTWPRAPRYETCEKFGHVHLSDNLFLSITDITICTGENNSIAIWIS